MYHVKSQYPRSRSRGSLTSPARAEEWAKDVNCSTPSYFLNSTYSPGAKLGEVEQMNDIVTPGFHRRSEAGEVIMTPMSKTRTVCTSSCTTGGEIQTVATTCASPVKRARYDQRGDVLGYRLSPTGGVVLPQSLITDLDIKSMMTEAGTQCNAAHAANSNNDLVESAAQAYAMGLPLISHARSAHLWLNKFERRVQAGHDVGSAWLHLRYGLIPTIRDMSAILRGMNVKPSRDRRTFRGFSQMRLSLNEPVEVGGSVVRLALNKSVTDHVNVRAMMVSEVLLDGLSDAGVTAGNLITLPWNLIPYSFVVDWFANVADFLQSSVPTLTSNILGSVTVVSRTQTVKYDIANTFVNGSAYTLVKPANGTFSSLFETKYRVGSLSAPGLVVRSDFRLSNLIRITDALSLLAMRVGTVFRDPISGRRRK